MKHHVYLHRSRKFITTSECLKSFEVDSSRHAAVKPSQVESDVLSQVDHRRLGVILASSRVTFLYLSNSQVYSHERKSKNIWHYFLSVIDETACTHVRVNKKTANLMLCSIDLFLDKFIAF